MSGNNSSMASSPTRAEALTFQSSVAGAVIPWLRGMHRVPGNLVWYGDFAAIAHQQQQGGKGGGGSTSTSYTYTSSLVMIAAHGPVQDIPQVWKGKSKTSRSALGLSLLSGAIGQAAWSGLAGKGVENIGYSGLAGVAVAAYDLGDSSSVENHSFEVRHASAYGTVASSPDVDPVPAVRELLTDTHRGAGMPDELLGDWTSWSQSCVANSLLMSPLLLTQAPAHDAFALVTELTNAAIVWSEGKIKVRSYFDQEVTAHGVTYTPDTVPVYQLDDSCYISSDDEAPVRVSLKTSDDRFNSVTVEYKDRSNGYNVATVTAKDLTDISANGVRAMSNVTAHWICDAQVARLVAEIKKQRSLLVVGEYTIRLPWHYALIECMDLLTLTDSVLQMLDVPVRVKTIVEESDEELLITCEDYPAGVASAPRYAAQVPAGFALDALVAPGTATDAMFFEAPAALAAGGTGLEVWAAVRSAGAQWGGCTVWVSLDQVNYRAIGQVSAGARNGTLSAPISGGTLTLQGLGGQLVGASAEDAAALATLCYIGGAQPEYLAYQTASLTGAGAYALGGLVRGAYGSNALAHSAGDPFVRVDDAIVKSGGLDVSYIGKRIYFKLTSWNIFGTSEQSLADVAAMPYDVSGLFARASPGTAGRGLTLKASAQAIKQDSAGARLPAAITLTAELKGTLQGSPTWSVVSGAATLSGAGLQRSLDTSTVTAPARIRVELVDELGTYSDEVTINLLSNGADAPKFARPALYQWAPLQPAAPTGQATYTWANGSLSSYTGGNSWQIGLPANPGTAGAKLWQAAKQVQAAALETTTVVTYGGADVTVSSVAANGVGQQTAEAAIYCWALNLAALPSLVGTSTYTWAGSSLSAAPSGWSLQPGSAATPGQTLYKASVRVSDATTEPTTTVNWTLASTNAIGYAGTVGTPGGPGASARIAYAKVTGVTIGAGQVQTTGSASLPPVNAWGRSETWATTVPALSATESIMLTNGMYDPSTDKVTWGSPYLATWKVGKLSAITADLGDITAGSINIGNGKFTVSSAGDAVMRSLQVVRDSDGKVILNAAAALPIDHSVVNAAAGWLNENVKVGGTNLMRNSGKFGATEVAGWTAYASGSISLDASVTYGGNSTLKITSAAAGSGALNSAQMRLKPSTQYTVSAMVRSSVTKAGGYDTHLHIHAWTNENPASHQDIAVSHDTALVAGEMRKIYQTFTTPASPSLCYCRFYFLPVGAGEVLNVGYVKLEEGNVATDWSPATEDVSAASAAAKKAADDAQTASNTANGLLTDWAADGKLSPIEKQAMRKEWDGEVSAKAGINTQATAFGITTENTTYNTALQALGNYLHGGSTWTLSTSVPPWWITDDQLKETTDIVGATLRSTWKTYTDAKQALLNKIAAVAATRADWAELGGRPADDALLNSYLLPSIAQAAGENMWVGSLATVTGNLNGASIVNPAYLDPLGTATAVTVRLPVASSHVYYRAIQKGECPAGWYTASIKVLVTSAHSIVFSATDANNWDYSEYAIAANPNAAATWVQVSVRQYVAAGMGLDVVIGSYHRGGANISSSPVPTEVAIWGLEVRRGRHANDLDATKGATWGTNISGVPTNLAQLTGSEGIKNELLTTAIQDAAKTANWGDINSVPGFTAFATLSKLTKDNASSYIDAQTVGLSHINTATITNLAALATYTGTLTVGDSVNGVGNGFIRMGKTGFGAGNGLYIGQYDSDLSFDLGDENDYVRWRPSTGWVQKRSNLTLSLNGTTMTLIGPNSQGSYPWSQAFIGEKTISVTSNGVGPYSYSWSVIHQSVDSGGSISITGNADGPTIGLKGDLPVAGAAATALIRCTVRDTSNGKIAEASFSAQLSSGV